MKRSVYFLWFLLSSMSILCAQNGKGSITGVVTDATGAVVSGVELTVTEKDTGIARVVFATDSGTYYARYLAPGTYQVEASKIGFKKAIVDNINLLINQVLTIDLVLEIGDISEEILVVSLGPPLESSLAEIGVNATEKEVHTWPILVGDGTRQLQDFVFRAMPGTQGGTFAGTINGGQAYSHEILIEGITLGRMDLNGAGNNEFTPTMDAVSGFRLLAGALTSQYGATQTALVNFGMKSGGNGLHGTIFWFHKNKELNANSWMGNLFRMKKNPFLENNFGATVGGPIIQYRTHFFLSYEGERFIDQTINGFENLPTRAFKSGDFTQLLDPAFTGNSLSGTMVGEDLLGRELFYGQIFDPATARQIDDGNWVRDPFPGNLVPIDRFSSVTRRILSAHDLPDPNDESRLLRNHPRVGTCCPFLNINNISVKFDHVLTENHVMSSTLIFNDRGRNRFGFGTPRLPGVDFPGPAAAGFREQTTPGWIIRFSENWTIGPTLINHFAAGFNRFLVENKATSFLAGTNWKDELGLKNDQPGKTFPVALFQGSSSSLGGLIPTHGDSAAGSSPNGSLVFQNDLSWVFNQHNLRFGFEHRRYFDNQRITQTNGSYTFHSENTSQAGFSNQTGFSYTSFLMGDVFEAVFPIRRSDPELQSHLTVFYVQDDWKVRPDFTLNLGLRWDIPTPIFEKAGRMSSLNPFVPNPGTDGFPGSLDFLDNRNERWANIYWKQVGPRVGFAWSPRSDLVLRGGYGINYSPPIRDGWYANYSAGFNGSNPLVSRQGRFDEESVFNWDLHYPAYQHQLPDRDPTLQNASFIDWYLGEENNDLGINISKQPMVQNWNIGIQLDAGWETRIEINYVGNKGTRLNAPAYLALWPPYGGLNQADPSHLSLGDTLVEDIVNHPEIPRPYPSFSGTVGRALRPFPQYEGVITHRFNHGWSFYHALHLTATRRSRFGLSCLTSYTFSKTLGTSDSAGPGAYSYYGQDFYNRKADYGVSLYHYPHDLKLTWIYDLPFGVQGRWAISGWKSKVLGGWTLSGILRYRCGNPLQVTTGGYRLDALFNQGVRADVLLTGDAQTLPAGELDSVSGTQYLNPDAFGSPPKTNRNVPLRLGTAPRWLPRTRGAALLGEDLSIIKRTDLRFREGANFEVRFDFINLFNRTRWSDPVNNVNFPDFGKVFYKGGIGPRNIQAGLRFNW